MTYHEQYDGQVAETIPRQRPRDQAKAAEEGEDGTARRQAGETGAAEGVTY